MIVYKITNTLNNKCYIGITKHNFYRRYNYRHDWWNSPSVSPILQNSAKKNNGKNFVVEVLEEVSTILDLLYLESYYIKYFNSIHPFGYNLTTGGDYNEPCDLLKKKHSDLKKGIPGKGLNVKGHKKSIEQIKKVIDTKKHKFASGDLVPWNKGKKIGPMSPETIKKSAEGHKKAIKAECLETGSSFVASSAIDIERMDLGFNSSSICRACKLNVPYKGFKFYHLDLNNKLNNKE
jgi:group I intron endonuclease